MARHPLKSEIGYIADTTDQGERPSGSDWNGATLFRHVSESVDVSGLGRELIADMRSQTRINQVNRHVIGLSNRELPAQVYITGTGQDPTDTNAADQTVLADLLEQGFGGIHITDSATVAAGVHTSTVLDISSATSYAVGCIAAFVHPTTGEVYHREVTAIDSAELTLDEALPWTPSENDVLKSCITAYVDESVLEDSEDGGGSGPHTQAVIVRKGGAGSDEVWELLGGKWQCNTLNFPRGDLPTLDLTFKCAKVIQPNDAARPTFSGTPSGLAPTVMGTRTLAHLQDFGTSTSTSVCISDLSIELGLQQEASQVVTESDDNMEGICSWGLVPADTVITFSKTPFEDSFWDDIDASTDKVFRFMKHGEAGNAFSVTAPRCHFNEDVSRGANDVHSSNQIVLRAYERDSGTDLVRSKIKIGLS
jgi:hypothetical protein